MKYFVSSELNGTFTLIAVVEVLRMNPDRLYVIIYDSKYDKPYTADLWGVLIYLPEIKPIAAFLFQSLNSHYR